MVGHKLWKRYLRWFDGSFSKGWFDQVKFLSILILGFMGLWYLVSLSYGGEHKFLHIIELMMDPGAFIGSDEYAEKNNYPILLSWLIAISGVVLFSAMLITVIGNIVSNRIDEFKKGLLRYDFDNHILILGANSMLVNMLKELAKESDAKKRRIVILTNKDTEALQDMVSVKYPEVSKELNVTYMYGHRELEETVRCLQADEAHSIYILGEDDEPDHDSKNVQCWKTICKLCSKVKEPIPCYMVVDRLSSFHVFQFSENESCGKIRLTVINSLENWAQRVLVARDYEEGKRYPSIIGKESEDYKKDVRFVVFGMTQMAYAMATTVAHIVHKPYFKGGAKASRTKISFIMPDIRQEMNFFKGHYESLFKLSHSSYWSYNGNGWDVEKEAPDANYGDFLDVEWEFINGSIEEEHVRRLLCQYASNENEYLSIAVCNHRTEENISASLYLPGMIYEKDVPVFVYQPNEGDILKLANGTLKYSNVYPFGMKHDCYDPLFNKRLEKAKKIKYLYTLQDSGKPYMGMPSKSELDALWNTLTSYVLMYSNVYAANSIPVKLQLLGLDPDNLANVVAFTNSEIETLAEMEHNRWNIEKLLMGFSALTIDERAKMKAALCSNDEAIVAEAKAENRRLKTKELKHKDITPFSDLLNGSIDYDRAIVKNIVDVWR